MAEDFQIKITTTGDPKGAEQVAAALGKVTKATAESAKETRTLTQDVTSLGSRQNATKDVLEGLDSALKGNAMSMFGVAKAAKNLWEIFTVSTPAGRALQLAMVAVGTAAQFMGRASEEAGEAAQVTSKDMDAMREAAEAFNKVRFDTINAQFDALKAKSDSSVAFFTRLADLSKQLDDASLSLDLARINADPSLSPEEKERQTLAARDRFGRRALERDEGLRGAQLAGLRTTAAGAATKASDAEAQRAMDAFLVSGLQGQRSAAAERLLLAEDAVKNFRKSGNPESDAGELSNLAIAARRAGGDLALSPAMDAQIEVLKGRLKISEAAAEAAQKAAAEAQRKLADAERLAPIEQRTGRDLADLSSRERYTAAGLDLPSRRRAPDSDVVRPAPIVDSFTLMSLAREQGKTTGQVLADIMRAALEANNAAMSEEVANRLRRTQN